MFIIGTYIEAAKKEEIQDISKVSWIGKTWYEGTKFYFSGMSEPSYNLKKAKELAYNDAVLNAAKYLGVKISNKTISNVNNNVVKINEHTQSSLEDSLISAAIIKEFYFGTTSCNKQSITFNITNGESNAITTAIVANIKELNDFICKTSLIHIRVYVSVLI